MAENKKKQTSEKQKDKENKISREYTIPLRKKTILVPRYKKANRAVKAIKEFLVRHMKVRDRDLSKVKLEKYINEYIWYRGIKKPPAKVKVKAEKDPSTGIVHVELVNIPEKLKYKKQKEERATKEAQERAEQKKQEQQSMAQKAQQTMQAKGKSSEKPQENQTSENQEPKKSKEDSEKQKEKSDESKKSEEKKTSEKKTTKKKSSKKSTKSKSSSKSSTDKKDTGKTQGKKSSSK